MFNIIAMLHKRILYATHLPVLTDSEDCSEVKLGCVMMLRDRKNNIVRILILHFRIAYFRFYLEDIHYFNF